MATVLHAAVESGNLEKVRRLLEDGTIRVDGNDVKQTPLHFAVKLGHVDIVRALLDAGADPNKLCVPGNGCSYHPLHCAMAVQAPGAYGFSAFKTNQQVLEIVQMLVEAGADVNESSCIALTFEEYRHFRGVEVVLSNLECAACYKRWETVSYLLAHGADLNAKDDYDGSIALHYAIAAGCPDTVAVLLQAGAAKQIKWEINVNNFEHPYVNGPEHPWNALHIIGIADRRLLYPINNHAISDYAKIINMLVENGAELNKGVSPLHSACAMEDLPILSAYLHGLDVKWCVRLAEERTGAVISALLQAGADPNLLTVGRQSPLHVLLTNVMSSIENRFDDGSNGYSRKEKDRIANNVIATVCNAVRSLVESGADVNQRNAKGEKPLDVLMNGMVEYFQKKNYELSENRAQAETVKGTRRLPKPFAPNHEIDQIIVELVRCGADSWKVVPGPCHGLQKALVNVWKREDTAEISYLFEKLEPRFKQHVRACLLLFNRCLPGAAEIHMRIMELALQ